MALVLVSVDEAHLAGINQGQSCWQAAYPFAGPDSLLIVIGCTESSF
jgi:hypothetical protein